MIIVAWSSFIFALDRFHVSDERDAMVRIARVQTEAAIEKDIVLRAWASMHGGVYVPTTETTPPNPYLEGILERDLVTPSGRALTLVNPAYMTRQVHELQRVLTDKRSHITSLDPIRPENAADTWEAAALRSIAAGRADYSAEVEIDGQPYYRMMKPLYVQTSCLNCHASQGYAIGDLRGGISAAVPLRNILSEGARHHFRVNAGYAAIWLIGLAGVLFGFRGLDARVRTLAAAETRFRAVVDGSTDGIMAANATSRRLLLVNPAMAAMLGYAPDELIGRTIDCLHDEERRPQIIDIFDRTARGESTSAHDVFFRRKDGSLLSLDVTNSVIHLMGDHAVLGIFRDSTARKEAEENRLTAMSQQALLGQLASTVAHEVNNPLFAIRMQINSLLKKCPINDFDCHERLSLVREQIDRISRTVQTLLGLSRATIQTEGDSDILEILSAVIRLYETVFANRGIRFETRLPPELPPVVGSRSRIQEVILNIVENARQALEGRIDGAGVMISARLAGDQVEVLVEDTGPGLGEPPERVFKPFYTTKVQGTGLGLAIAKKSIEEFGGQLLAENRSAAEGGGARFRILLRTIALQPT